MVSVVRKLQSVCMEMTYVLVMVVWLSQLKARFSLQKGNKQEKGENKVQAIKIDVTIYYLYIFIIILFDFNGNVDFQEK